MEKYRSAIIAFKTTLEKFPDMNIKRRFFYDSKANFMFASNSIESKKVERFEATIDSYLTFVTFESSFQDYELLQLFH